MLEFIKLDEAENMGITELVERCKRIADAPNDAYLIGIAG